MSFKVSNYRKKLKWVENFLRNGQKGTTNHNSLQESFCEKNISNNRLIGGNTEKVNTILKEITLPHTLSLIYKIIGEVDSEFYLNNWTLMSLDSIIARQKIYIENKQERVIDFALGYMGMGHMVIVAFDPIDFKIFFRRDGGSNGWDRETNWEYIKTYKPNEADKHDFSVWVKLIEEKKKAYEIMDEFCIN